MGCGGRALRRLRLHASHFSPKFNGFTTNETLESGADVASGWRLFRSLTELDQSINRVI